MQLTLFGGTRLVASLATVLLVAATPWTIPSADAQSLPAGWSVADVGGPASPGTAAFVSPTFIVMSRGVDVNGVADQFTFAYRSVPGDITIIARLKTLPNVDPWAQAGLMIRRDTSERSKHLFVFGTPGNGVVVRSRQTRGGGTTQTLSGPATVPVWLKLERRSSTLTAFRSNDGASWTPVRTLTLPMSSQLLVGLAVASRSTTVGLTAAFDSVTINGQSWVVAQNVPPAVSLTSPANGSSYTSPASVALGATATDADGTVAKVDFYAGATLVGTDSTSPFAYTWTGAAVGSHALKAVATDNSGAATTSALVNITVSAPNVAPTVSLTTPVNGATFTAPATIAIAATAADSDGTVAKVDFYAGATLVGTDATSPFAYTWSGAAAGTYAVTARATDNRGATTTSGTVNVTVSGAGNVAPTVSLTSPAHGAAFVVGALVTFAATATDPDGSVQKVEFYLGPILVATDTTSPYSTTWPAVIGSHSISAVATDNLGARTVSAWRDFTVTASALLSTAVFTPASPAGAVDYYVVEIFAAGADPNVAAPIATRNIGLPPVVAGECSADVRATIVALASGNYIATVAAMTSEGKLRSNTFAFTR